MIQIANKVDCCGCAGCMQKCPKGCISFQEDSEGFFYPIVDTSRCVNCGLCEKVCLMHHRSETVHRPILVYAAKNADEKIRLCSSSGGVFTALAEKVIDNGGVVFGACFDEKYNVIHGYAETKEDLCKLRGSKYVQSYMGDNYKKAEMFLKAGREVLFSGTPCQITGLRLFLQKSYENLYTVDFICHGVPSPGIWRQALKEEIARQCDRKHTVLPRLIHEKDVLVEGISFRDKTLGWKKYSFTLALSTTNESGEKFSFCSRIPFRQNLFMKGFMANLYLRPSCYACSAKGGRSLSNLTMGDFWGIDKIRPDLNDDKGISALLVNDMHGFFLLNGTGINLWQMDYKDVLCFNSALEKSAVKPKEREMFWNTQNVSLSKRIMKYTKLPLKFRIKLGVVKLLAYSFSQKQRNIIKNILRIR